MIAFSTSATILSPDFRQSSLIAIVLCNQGYYINKKEGRQLDLILVAPPSATTIFSFIYGVVMNRLGGGLG